MKFGEFEIQAAFADEDGHVLMCGKVFEVGDYPDKGFAISPAEMDDAIAAFSPVDANLEHSQISTVLGNALGGLQRMWRSGRHVLGEVKVPRWLSELTGGKMAVSLEFDAGKRVVGIGYTLNPRITDAQVAAAFSANEEQGTRNEERGTRNEERGQAEFGENTLDELHRCDAELASRVEALITQGVSERLMAIFGDELGAQFAGARNSGKDQMTIQEAHDATVRLGATCATNMTSGVAAEGKVETGADNKLTLKERVLAWFKRTEPENIEEAEIEAALTVVAVAGPANDGALQEMAASFAKTQGEAFADNAIRDDKAAPAERDALINAFTLALEADGGGKFAFANGSLVKGKHVDAQVAIIDARSKMTLTGAVGQIVDVSKFTVIDTEGAGTPEKTPIERKRKLMKNVTGGPEALARGEKGGA